MARRNKETAITGKGSAGKRWSGSFRANYRWKKRSVPSVPGIEERYGSNAESNRKFLQDRKDENLRATKEARDAAIIARNPHMTPPPGMTLDEYRAQLRSKRRAEGGKPKSALGRAISRGMSKSAKWRAFLSRNRSK